MEIKNEKSTNPNNDDLKKKWLLTTVAGLALLSVGLCVFSAAAFAKHDGGEIGAWIGKGILALALINAGVFIFGNSIVQKSYMESRRRLALRGNNRRKNFNKPKNKGPKKKPQENSSNE